MQLKKETWVDNVKAFACVLVALGHLFQSLMPMLSQESDWLLWFDRTIYYFHVPLFFICSGYLYQKHGNVDSIQNWVRNIKKKAITLGIPYVVFSFLTWLLKTVFAQDVNSNVGGLAHVLFVSPLSPYWYLYALFFIFCCTPTFRTKRTGLIILVISAVTEVVGKQYGNDLPKIIKYVLFYEVWFVLGMNLCMLGFSDREWGKRNRGLVIALLFVLLSVLIYKKNWDFVGLDFMMGFFGCAAAISVVTTGSQLGKTCKHAAYTMPIFLLHTMCAAPVRIVLVKAHITNIPTHIAAGIVASFLFPIIIAKIAERIKWLDFWIYPGKYLRI